MAGCVFCSIASKEIPADIIYETTNAFVIRDRSPAAKEHLLVIARRHSKDITDAFSYIAEAVVNAAWHYGHEHLPNGFRIVINTGEDAGQTMKHYHAHLLGGEKLKDL